MHKRIDAHIHTRFDNDLLMGSARISGVDYSLGGLKREMRDNHIQYAISMGLESSNDALLDQEADTPIVDEVSGKNVIRIGGINPHRNDHSNLSEVERALSSGEIRGLKIYLGYYPKYAYDDVYRPFYELAGRYGAPVIFHTGDNYDKNARVKFAHPLTLDEVAVDFRDTRFIVAHTGNPWTIDAGEVIYKNDNVYGDLSGLFTGDEESIDNIHDRDLEDIIKAYRWVSNPGKFLYGSDWPITPMGAYIRLVERILEGAIASEDYEYHHERVFRLNARDLFNL